MHHLPLVHEFFICSEVDFSYGKNEVLNRSIKYDNRNEMLSGMPIQKLIQGKIHKLIQKLIQKQNQIKLKTRIQNPKLWLWNFLVLLNFFSFFAMAENVSPPLKDTKKTTIKKIFILGDSLTEGYGVETSEAYPQQLQKKIDEYKPQQYQVVAAGVSGSTTASGLSRLQWLMKAKPSLVILALGSNDALRGLDVDATQKNVESMIEYLKKENTLCVLVGFQAPPNYGKEYTQKFQSIWLKLKLKYKLPFVPFLLEGVAGEKEFNIEDGIHPNPKGHQQMANTVFTHIKELL